MNKTYTILGKTYNLSEYDKNFPIGGDHPIWKFFDDYNVKVIGYDIKNLHDYDLNDMHDNFGIVDTQDSVYPEELESAVLLTGWNDKYPPPVVDTSRSKGGELNGRDRTKILKNLQQPHMPLLKIDASQVKDLPLAIVATKVSPKLSNDQLPGSRITSEVARSVPHVECPQRYVPQP